MPEAPQLYFWGEEVKECSLPGVSEIQLWCFSSQGMGSLVKTCASLTPFQLPNVTVVSGKSWSGFLAPRHDCCVHATMLKRTQFERLAVSTWQLVCGLGSWYSLVCFSSPQDKEGSYCTGIFPLWEGRAGSWPGSDGKLHV